NGSRQPDPASGRRRGALPATLLRPRSRSVVPKTGVTSDPAYVVGTAATKQTGPRIEPLASWRRNTAALAVPIGLPPPSPTRASAFRERASSATSSAVASGT